MNNFKFRGWDKVGQKGWVFGDLVHNQKVTKDGLEPRTMVGGYEVDEASVGLCTGLKDSKGTEIYQGDIIRVFYGGKKVFDAPVVWNESYAAFLMDEGDMSYSPLPNADMDTQIRIEVIGNKYQKKYAKKNSA